MIALITEKKESKEDQSYSFSFLDTYPSAMGHSGKFVSSGKKLKNKGTLLKIQN